MKLGILSNFGPGNGIGMGGCEMVISELSQYLIENLNYEITVLAFNYDKEDIYRGINIVPCKKDLDFISQLNEFEHILVYSDSFWQLGTLVNNINIIKPDVTVALVGAYYLNTHLNSLKIIKDNINRFNIITHSDITSDYKWAIKNKLEVNVIPNGVKLSEFEKNDIKFREKYNIKEKYVFLVVSNFLYGKGQEIVSAICRRAFRANNDIRNDFSVVFLYNSIKYNYADRFLYNCEQIMKEYKSYFFGDLSREDVISAFKSSDIFLFPSKKEVSPLVILESQAAGLPWVSMNVGDVENRKGGIVLNSEHVDLKGFKIITPFLIDGYLNSLSSLVKDKELRDKLIKEGKEDIQQYDWNNIYQLYDKVFKR